MNVEIISKREDGEITYEYRGHFIKRSGAKTGLNRQAQPWTGRKVYNGTTFIIYYNGQRIPSSEKNLLDAVKMIDWLIRRDTESVSFL